MLNVSDFAISALDMIIISNISINKIIFLPSFLFHPVEQLNDYL